jgi:thymidylate kinase
VSEAGVFIAFEGGEGAGKSSRALALAGRLRAAGYEAVLTFEPGDSRIGRQIRDILLDVTNDGLDPRAEALLYAADRAEHVASVVRPALDRGAVVITDRYVDSSIATPSTWEHSPTRGLRVDSARRPLPSCRGSPRRACFPTSPSFSTCRLRSGAAATRAPQIGWRPRPTTST